jgi:CTP:molybdopterin cytidylyltransferase MocA
MGEFKPLMPLGGMPVLERVIRLFRTAGVGRIHVVIGHRRPELTPLVERQGARDVPVADQFIHADMDTPADYRRLAGLIER